jgi:5,10-methylenetetrahydromethanopterin reductase
MTRTEKRVAQAELPVVSCTFAPSLDTPGHIELAEALGYRRAFVYDSPSLYADPWMILALAATRTRSIGLGVATLVPSLRHPLVNAAALATLAGLAPGRVSAAFGTGLTGRMLLGQRPMKWAEVIDYVTAVRALLRGEEAEWDGRAIRLLHPAGFAASRPVEATILIAADGPKGAAVAASLGEEIITARTPSAPGEQDVVLLAFGSVLNDGEAADSPRALAAAAPALAVGYHAVYEARGAGVDRLPGGQEWRESVETVDPSRRHLAVHDGHLVQVNRHDEAMLPHAVHLLPKRTLTGSRAEVRERLATFRAAGAAEIAYQPMGPDIERELRAFAEATKLT